MRNDITGDRIRTKVPSKKYLENYDKIFRKDKPKKKPTNEADSQNKRS